MKSTIYLSFLSLFLLACQGSAENETSKEAELAEVKPSYSFYGEEITDEGVISYEDFTAALNESDTVNVKLAGSIAKTCTVKGCWMKVNVDGVEEPMHVTFKDYGFFVPKEGMEDKDAIFEGIAFVDTLSVDMLRHYAEDEGLSVEEIAAITEPEVLITFEAAGVLIEK